MGIYNGIDGMRVGGERERCIMRWLITKIVTFCYRAFTLYFPSLDYKFLKKMSCILENVSIFKNYFL